MCKWHKYGTWFLLTLALLSVSMGFANAETSTFKDYADDSHFIASRGNISNNATQEWDISLQNCWLNMTGISYYKYDESIKSIGGGNGILMVYVGSAYEGEIDELRIDEMYQKIESYCEENNGISDVPVVFVWAEDEDDLIFEYDPSAFENITYSPNFIAARGTVPTFESENEWDNWSNAVFEERQIDELDQYYASQGGILLSYGFNMYSGYIEIEVNKNTPEKVNDSSIDEIYQIIEEHYQNEGISNIPVVFMWGEPMIEDSPGFTSFILVLCISILVKIRK